MKSITLLILLLINIFFTACGPQDSSYYDATPQTMIIASGVVKDHLTKNALPSVSISVSSSSTSNLNSNSNGFYQIPLVAGTKYTLTYSLSGYKTITYILNTTFVATQTLQTVYLIPDNVGVNSSASGTITDLSTGNALDAVTIFLRHGIDNKVGTILASTTTIANGTYSFASIPVDTYTIHMKKTDYETNFGTLYVVGGLTGDNQNFTMSPSLFSVDGNQSTAGIIKSATTGIALNDVNVSLRGGLDNKNGVILLSALTENNGTTNGTYKFDNIAVGNYTAQMSLNGYITGYGNINVVDGEDANDKNFAITPELQADELLRMTLTWGAQPSDLDTYLLITTDDGNTSTDNTLYYARKTVTYGGVDYAILNTDDVTAYGPETVTVKHYSSGKYIYYIKNLSTSIDFNTSKASIQVFDPSNNTTVIDLNKTGTGRYWEVLHIDNGVVNIINQRRTSVPTL